MASKEELIEKLAVSLEGLGFKMSKDNAWKVFKACMDSAIVTTVEDQDNALSLSGVGKFEIIKAAPRSSKEGLVDFIPRLRFRPSIRVNQFLEETMGQVPDPVKLQAAKVVINASRGSNLPLRTPKGGKTEEFKDAF